MRAALVVAGDAGGGRLEINALLAGGTNGNNTSSCRNLCLAALPIVVCAQGQGWLFHRQLDSEKNQFRLIVGGRFTLRLRRTKIDALHPRD